MERLTFDGNFCDISQCRELPCKYDGNCTQRQVWERLKQFEDAFGTPEKAERVKLAFMGKAVYEIKEFNGVPLARLIELAEADKDGRVVILPCKVGDELWTFCNTLFKRVYSFQVSDVCTLNGWTVLNAHKFGPFSPEDIGKTVFLTREEAEEALQEMEGKKDG